MAAFECEVCFESKTKRLSLGRLQTGNGQQVRGEDCGHGVCMECLAAFVTARVEEQLVFGIRCPHEGCRNEIRDQDIDKLATEGLLEEAVRERFRELRRRDYTARASSLSEGLNEEGAADVHTLRRLWESTRLCPSCSLVIEKSEGCNSFFCICGHHFNYASAPRVVGNGVKGFGRVLDFAERHGLAVGVALQLGGSSLGLYGKARALASQVGLPLEEALSLQIRAFRGDEEARAHARALRAEARAAAEEADQEEQQQPFELPALDFQTDAPDLQLLGAEPEEEAPPAPEAPGPPPPQPAPLTRAASDNRERKPPTALLARLQRAASNWI